MLLTYLQYICILVQNIYDLHCIYFILAQLTLNDGKQDDNDEEEESDVKDDTIEFVLVTVRRLDLITNTTASAHTLVQVEHEALPEDKVIVTQRVKISLCMKSLATTTCTGLYYTYTHATLIIIGVGTSCFITELKYRKSALVQSLYVQ